MQSDNKASSYRNAELVVRKAALVDTSNLSEPNNDSKGIRDRVNSFLRSKKKKSKVVQEVKDIESIYTLLGEGQKEAVYTAVIFHAPYCRACKASMPLFEELARQYNKRNLTYTKLNKKYTNRQNQNQRHPVVKFLSVPVTQDNSKDLQERFSVTKFPLAHIYDPFGGLVDERPILRKLFPKFEERLESVVVEAFPLLELETSLLETSSN
jgi:thiol-disulfide isomerase/thioredoxin